MHGHLPSSGLNILRRDDDIAAISCQERFPTVIKNNTILDNPQMGILLGNYPEGAVQIVAGNTLHPNTVVTNGYAIYVTDHARILDNTITTTETGSSEGIFVENLSAMMKSDIQIAGNSVYVQDRGNRESGTGISERAFKLRNYGTGGFADVNVTKDTFIAATKAGGYMTTAAGASAYFNGANTNIVFSNNLFKGLIVGATDPGNSYTARGFEIDKSAPGEDILFLDNTFESDVTGLVVGTGNSSDNDHESDLLFVDNIFRKSSDGVAQLRVVQVRRISSHHEQLQDDRLNLPERCHGGHHLGRPGSEGRRFWMGAEPDGHRCIGQPDQRSHRQARG